jgi:hypothetical protein
MARDNTLGWRRTAAQRQALAEVEREIRACDPHTRRKYLRDFNQAFRSYAEVLTRPRLESVLRSADILLVGDYHALPAYQQFCAELVRKLACNPRQARGAGWGARPVVLGVEFILSRDQHIIDLWAANEISESELRQRLRFDLDWGYDWEPFYSLLDTARRSRAVVRGLDCLPRNDLRNIALRDRHAAETLGEIRRQSAGARLIVLFGESHLAPNHLPALLAKACPSDRILTVLQNVDALCWQAAGEETERVDAVRVQEDVVCVFNTPPIEKYEAYRQCLENWRGEWAEKS